VAVTSAGSAAAWAGAPWRVGRSGLHKATAVLTPIGPPRPPSEDEVRRLLELLAADGLRQVLTGALTPLEAAPYLQAGFEAAATLVVLTRRLGDPGFPLPLPDRRPRATLRRARRSDEAAVLDLDHAAFPAFWRLDATGLLDARRATPRSRYRVAIEGAAFLGRLPSGSLVGYAITGRAGPRGFLQRLAVAPGHQRKGLGRLLVLDGLRWLQRAGAEVAAVNTEPTNDAAVALYRGLGFRPEADGLVVLRASLS
jgi:ribosomal protein S18 acetylase RimI-like enzyme